MSQYYLGDSGNGSASVIDTVTCPNDTFVLPQCIFDTTSQEPCVSPDNYLVVQCSSGKFSLVFPFLLCSLSSLHLMNILHVHVHVGFQPPSCFDGQTRLADNYTTSDGVYEYINGTVEVCVDGQYVPICGHSDYGIEANITDDIGISVCYSIGYYGEC